MNSIVVLSVTGVPAIPTGMQALTIQEEMVGYTLSTAVTGTIPGTYLQSSVDALTVSLNKAKTINESNTLAEISQMTTQLTAALKIFKSSVIYTTNKLTTGDYTIKKAGTNLFWTNTNANKYNLNFVTEKPAFETEIPGSNDQLFHLSILSNGRYEIDSKSDVPAYINENVYIRRNTTTFLADWNSFNILYNGSAYAVQTAGSGAGSGFWSLVSDVVTGSGITTLNPETNFILDFVKKAPTAVTDIKESPVKVIPMKDGIQVLQDQLSVIAVYNMNGSMVKKISASGNTWISLSSGFYIVKIQKEDEIFILKTVVR
jgi:hypothetical protein